LSFVALIPNRLMQNPVNEPNVLVS
jgi:hypothetical protein